MFWSPAVTTLSVVWAAAGTAHRAPIAAATNSMRSFMTPPGLRLTKRRGAREQQQRVAWNGDGNRRAFRDAFGRMPPHVRAVGAHAVAVDLAHVECLDHLAGQHDFAGGGAR